MDCAKPLQRQPLVSVCIPSYNASRTMGDTIRSVLDSAYSNIEVIVSDDASTDGTEAIVQALNDGRVRFFQNTANIGPVANWNLALQKASGDFVGLLNHDDLYGPFWLTFAVHTLQKYPHIGWVNCAFRVIDDEGQTLDLISRFANNGEIDRTDAFLRVATLNGLGPGYLARREILEASAYYDVDAGPGADNDLYLRLAARYPLYYSTRAHVAWRLHTSNLTHRWGKIEQAAEGFYILRKTFDDPTLPEELRAHRGSCYAFYCRKVIARRDELLQRDQLETAQELTRLLRENGCEG